MTCGATDAQGRSCFLDGAHAYHSALDGADVITWENSSMVAPPMNPKSTFRSVALAAQRSVATLPDPAQPSARLRSEPHETERAAADASKLRNASRKKQVLRVVAAATEAGHGVTDDEIALVLNDPNVPAPRVATRRGELVEMGWVEAMTVEGLIATRATRTGQQAMVWVLTPEGAAQVGEWLWQES